MGTLSFSDLIDRIVRLVWALPELEPYRSVAHAMLQWRAQASPGKGDSSDWPRPSEYLRLLGWDGRLSGRAQGDGGGGGDGDGSQALRYPIRFIEPGTGALRHEGPDPRDGERPASQSRRRPGSAAAYVALIAQGGLVTTRLHSVHDLANAMTWAAFPELKWTVFGHLWNEVQDFEHVQRVTEPGRGRSPRSDRLTQLDEAGVLGAGATRLFFGHALLEHLFLARPGQVNAPLWLLHDSSTSESLADRMAVRLATAARGDEPMGTYPVGGPGLWAPCGFNETCLQE